MTTRVAMVSGASRGIGAAIAGALAAQGWRLSLGARNPLGMAAPEGAFVYAYDALAPRGAPESAEAWVAATVEHFGRIDAIVANAGIMIAKSVIEADEDELQSLFDVNVKAPQRLVRAAWPQLVATGRGRVVTIVSLSGKRVKSARSGSYAVSKFAALALTHAIRHAGWDEGVRATAICPGFVATDMAAALTPQPAQDLTQPEDVARLVLTALELPNTASVAEIAVNWMLEESY